MSHALHSHPYASFVHTVDKPARYLGGEYNQIVKDPESVRASLCLAFPDVYDIGMSHLGTKILYKLINGEPDLCAERAFTPWIDMGPSIARFLPAKYSISSGKCPRATEDGPRGAHQPN